MNTTKSQPNCWWPTIQAFPMKLHPYISFSGHCKRILTYTTLYTIWETSLPANIKCLQYACKAAQNIPSFQVEPPNSFHMYQMSGYPNSQPSNFTIIRPPMTFCRYRASQGRTPQLKDPDCRHSNHPRHCNCQDIYRSHTSHPSQAIRAAQITWIYLSPPQSAISEYDDHQTTPCIGKY